MEMIKTMCCAIQEIGGLCNHRNCPEDAMRAFCEQNLAKPVRYGTCAGRSHSLYSFYLFTAAVGAAYDTNTYGHQFANYIKTHGLGEVWESKWVVNTAFHPDHGNQVWIWTPDLDAIKKWWAARGSK